MKLIDLVNAQPALRELSSMKLPVKTSFRVARFLKSFAVEIEAYEKARLSLLDQFGKPGTRTDKGVEYAFDTPESITAYNSALAPLNEEDVTIDIPLIPIEDLGDIALEPGLMYSLIGVLLQE